MKKKLIFVAAPPACGKTYVSERIAHSLENIVYLDKDYLSDLIRATFAVAGQPLDMDGDFYKNSIRSAEYSTIMGIAFSTLRFADKVLLNAPFGKEVRDTEYMKQIKEKANSMGADLILIWVTAPLSVCYERMKMRNSDRDTLKLKNWDAYISNINYAPPFELAEKKAIDSFFIFDTKDDATFQSNFDKAINLITGDKL